MMKIDEISQAVEKGKKKIIAGLVQEALDEGCDAMDILNIGMIGAMDKVGENFKNGDIYVPEMLIAAKTMKKGVDVLKPHCPQAPPVPWGNTFWLPSKGIFTILEKIWWE